VPSRKSVRVQCLQCGHFSVFIPELLSRLAVTPTTPIAAFVKRLRCRECGSQSVLATRKPPQPPIASQIATNPCDGDFFDPFFVGSARASAAPGLSRIPDMHRDLVRHDERQWLRRGAREFGRVIGGPCVRNRR
jgi:hypothetical protein